jgi:hypothetical protein
MNTGRQFRPVTVGVLVAHVWMSGSFFGAREGYRRMVNEPLS